MFCHDMARQGKPSSVRYFDTAQYGVGQVLRRSGSIGMRHALREKKTWKSCISFLNIRGLISSGIEMR